MARFRLRTGRGTRIDLSTWSGVAALVSQLVFTAGFALFITGLAMRFGTQRRRGSNQTTPTSDQDRATGEILASIGGALMGGLALVVISVFWYKRQGGDCSCMNQRPCSCSGSASSSAAPPVHTQTHTQTHTHTDAPSATGAAKEAYSAAAAAVAKRNPLQEPDGKEGSNLRFTARGLPGWASHLRRDRAFGTCLRWLEQGKTAKSLHDALRVMRETLLHPDAHIPADARAQLLRAAQEKRAAKVETWTESVATMFGEVLHAMAEREAGAVSAPSATANVQPLPLGSDPEAPRMPTFAALPPPPAYNANLKTLL